MTRDDALADISFLEHVLEDRFAYLDVGSTDHRVLFEDLRLALPAELETSWLGLRLQKLMARFIDGHAAVDAPPHPRGFLPFLTGWTGDTLVAFEADRSALLDPERPYLVAIDGVDVASWLTAAAAYVPAGSPQFVKRGSLRWLRAVQMLRADLGLPQVEDVAVTVAGAGGASKRTLRLAVADRAPQFGTWPRGESRTLDGNVGYLRLETMTSEAAEDSRVRWRGSPGPTGS